MVNQKIKLNKLYYIIIVFIVIVVLYLIYMSFNKRTKLYESYKNSSNYKSEVSKNPMKEYNDGFETGQNMAKKEIDNAIEYTKKEKSSYFNKSVSVIVDGVVPQPEVWP